MNRRDAIAEAMEQWTDQTIAPDSEIVNAVEAAVTACEAEPSAQEIAAALSANPEADAYVNWDTMRAMLRAAASVRAQGDTK